MLRLGALSITLIWLGLSLPGLAAETGAEIEQMQRLIDDGRYGDAEAAGRDLIARIDPAGDSDSLRVAAILDRLAWTLVRGGKAASPETLALATRSLAIRERLLGGSHTDVAQSLQTLGAVRYRTADYDTALRLFERALRIQEATLGTDHPLTVRAMLNVGNVAADMGDLARARGLYEDALTTVEKTFSVKDLISYLNNLATVQEDLADLAAACDTYRRALHVAEKQFGADHPDVAVILDNLGSVLLETGGSEEARPLLERALHIRESRLGPEHHLVAMTLTNLGALLGASGEAGPARSMLERALLIRETALGAEHPDVAISLVALADLLFAQGDRAVARPLYERALRIREARLGPEHPHVGASLTPLAILDAADGRLQAAFDGAARAAEIMRQRILRTAPILSEREAMNLSALLTSALGTMLHLAPQATGADRQMPWARPAWDALLRSRALVLDEMARRHRTVLDVERNEVAGPARDLEQARRRLALMLTRGPGGQGAAAYAASVQEAQKEVERSERVLGERSVMFRGASAQTRAGLTEVAGALPARAALVAFARYAVPGPVARDTDARYLAFVLCDRGKRLRVVPIGSAKEIQRLINDWRRLVGAPPGTPEELRAYDEAGSALRRAVWEPLAGALGTARRVFIVPDGVLHQVSFAALPDEGDRYLLDTGPVFHYLSTERDLLTRDRGGRGQAERAGGGLLVLGDPDFESASGDPGEEAVAYYRGPLPDCTNFQALRFEPLPGSLAEADAIEALWRRAHPEGAGGGKGILKLTGPKAAEEALKSHASGRSILHLATHAFWFQDDCLSEGTAPRVSASRGADAVALPTSVRGPLLLSGLALAGANRRNEAADSARGEDGIMTAEEVATLDLRGMDWVVLSACQSGVGPVHSGEGVLGLRRAFQIAGASSLILTLWAVSDQDTHDWMRELYAARLAGADTPDSMTTASKRILEARRRAGASTHPFFWGAFVAAGDWR